MKQILITISPTGEIVVQAEGFVGPSCQEEVRQYAQNLGLICEEGILPSFYCLDQEEGEGEGKICGGLK